MCSRRKSLVYACEGWTTDSWHEELLYGAILNHGLEKELEQELEEEAMGSFECYANLISLG